MAGQCERPLHSESETELVGNSRKVDLNGPYAANVKHNRSEIRGKVNLNGPFAAKSDAELSRNSRRSRSEGPLCSESEEELV